MVVGGGGGGGREREKGERKTREGGGGGVEERRDGERETRTSESQHASQDLGLNLQTTFHSHERLDRDFPSKAVQ